MIGKLRRNHQHRYELPLLSAPVEMEARPVPMDPYALGLLLGDGCLTTSTTPSFATADPELAEALDDALEGIELVHRGGPDYVLRNVDGGRGGVIVTNPVTAMLRELELAGTRSNTKFVPTDYLLNDAETRLGVLQGLLDSDGGPVTQTGTDLPHPVHDVLADAARRRGLPRPLARRRRLLAHACGGGPHARAREGPAGASPIGRVHPRHPPPGGHRAVPAERKRAAYEATGGGRPMRFIESIEPVGTMETVCIQVAAADSLYVTDDFLVTHNTLNDSFIILDEAQNTTPEQMKMIMTRLGFNSKMVVTGDITQIDLPKDQKSGLITVSEILEGIEGIEFIRFGGEDVVRHRLVQRIVEAYDEHAARQAPELRPAERRRA